MNFDEKLKLLRLSKNLTQEQLAEKLLVTRSAVARWENGNGLPDLESMLELGKFFNVTISELLSDDDYNKIVSKQTKIKKNPKDLILAFLIFSK